MKSGILSTYESYLKNLKRRVSLKVDEGSEDSGIVVSGLLSTWRFAE